MNETLEETLTTTTLTQSLVEEDLSNKVSKEPAYLKQEHCFQTNTIKWGAIIPLYELTKAKIFGSAILTKVTITQAITMMDVVTTTDNQWSKRRSLQPNQIL